MTDNEKKPISQGFEDRFNSLIAEKNLNGSTLSHEIGIKQSTLNKWRGTEGSIKPSAENLYMLSKYFDVTMEWLLTGEGSKKPLRLTDQEEILLRVFNSMSTEEQGKMIKIGLDKVLDEK